MVSHGGDGLSPMSEKPDEGSKEVSSLMVDEWDIEVKGFDDMFGDGLTIEREV